MNSAIYHGKVSHVRFLPRKNRFSFRLFMVYLDLDELGNIFRHIPLWSDTGKKSLAYFNREDYLQPHQLNLKKAACSLIHQKTGVHHRGPVRILTNIRMWGLCFNPVSFYYCFNHNQVEQLDFVIAEITNTPWNERHQYILDLRKEKRNVFAKEFHISPFMDMDLEYDWRLSSPGDTIKTAMCISKKELRLMQVMLNVKRKPIKKWSMILIVFLSGAMNYKVVAAIYWHAAILYIKRIPFFSHPGDKQDEHKKN